MKALVLEADWDPRHRYTVTDSERASGKATVASEVWRHPRLHVGEVPDPSPAPDEVVVQIRACGVCGSDTHCYETDKEGYILFSGPTRLPCTLGHEYAGRVVEAGKEVKDLKVGDLVTAEGMLWCGLCTPCRTGHFNQCRRLEMVGFSAPGAFAQFIAVRERYTWKVNDLVEIFGDEDTACEAAALIEPAGCSYNGMFISAGGFLPGGYVVIYGAGPIGLGAVMLAKAAGASLVIIFDVSDARLEVARTLGADHAFNSRTLATQGLRPHEVVRELTRGEGADMQVEAAGAATVTVPEIEKSFAPVGKMVYLGRTGQTAPVFLDTLVSGANKIVGARGHAGYGVYPQLIRLLKTGRIPLHQMVTTRYPFSQVEAAIEKSTDRLDGKVMVRY